jgi:hypothetical protein
MAADLAASHVIDFKVFLAPQVGLEPTTLRLTGNVKGALACSCGQMMASVTTRWLIAARTSFSLPLPWIAISSYPLCGLRLPSFRQIATRSPNAPFDVEWAQKDHTGQSIALSAVMIK